MYLKEAMAIFNLNSLQGVSVGDVKKLYRNLAKLKHPDKCGGSGDDFRNLTKARAFLIDYIRLNNSEMRVECVKSNFVNDTSFHAQTVSKLEPYEVGLVIESDGYNESKVNNKVVYRDLKKQVQVYFDLNLDLALGEKYTVYLVMSGSKKVKVYEDYWGGKPVIFEHQLLFDVKVKVYLH